MNETKIFCSVIIFTIGIYTIIVLQYELFKLNRLSSHEVGTVGSGVGKAEKKVHVEKHPNPKQNPSGCKKMIIGKTALKTDRLNCGSTGDIQSVHIENCTQIPCDVVPNVNYAVSVNFKPSRTLKEVEVQTFARQRKNLKQLHTQKVQGEGIEDKPMTLKFLLRVPPHPVFKSEKGKAIAPKKCPNPKDSLYTIGVEIWDMVTGIGEICLSIPVIIF